MNRPPETLGELKKEILRQLDTSEVVTITLHEGDDIHELLESISSGIVDMTPEQQRIAIAEACGWARNGSSGNDEYPWVKPVNGVAKSLPDYLNDLNSMHEAEAAKIALDGLYQAQFCDHLFRVLNSDNRNLDGGISEFDKINATAAQRAEAFLKTLGLWDEA